MFPYYYAGWWRHGEGYGTYDAYSLWKMPSLPTWEGMNAPEYDLSVSEREEKECFAKVYFYATTPLEIAAGAAGATNPTVRKID